MNHTKFRALRKSTGLSMIKASKLFNTPYETWKSWESGKRRVPGIAVKALEYFLSFTGIDLNYQEIVKTRERLRIEYADLKKGGSTYNKIHKKGESDATV